MDTVFHYPPELLNLLIDTIPRLCRSKKDVLLFFRGAGVSESLMRDQKTALETNPAAVKKFEIARVILTRLNERGDRALRERREVLKRVVEFEDFSTCYPNDQLIAKGLVAQVRQVANVKDSFTRMAQEQEKEAGARRAKQIEKIQQEQARRGEREAIKKDLGALFNETNPQKRGKALEGVLNRLFRSEGVLVREAFALSDPSGQGIFEQIDGVIQLDGHLCLVEMKWWEGPLGPADVSQHMVRVFNRGHARGIFVSASGYTAAAVQTCRESLSRSPFVLCELREFVILLDRDQSLLDLLHKKTMAAIVDKNPLFLGGEV